MIMGVCVCQHEGGGWACNVGRVGLFWVNRGAPQELLWNEQAAMEVRVMGKNKKNGKILCFLEKSKGGWGETQVGVDGLKHTSSHAAWSGVTHMQDMLCGWGEGEKRRERKRCE